MPIYLVTCAWRSHRKTLKMSSIQGIAFLLLMLASGELAMHIEIKPCSSFSVYLSNPDFSIHIHSTRISQESFTMMSKMLADPIKEKNFLICFQSLVKCQCSLSQNQYSSSCLILFDDRSSGSTITRKNLI